MTQPPRATGCCSGRTPKRETVEAIRYDENNVSVSGLAERLGISRQLAWWRVRKAIKGRWLEVPVR